MLKTQYSQTYVAQKSRLHTFPLNTDGENITGFDGGHLSVGSWMVWLWVLEYGQWLWPDGFMRFDYMGNEGFIRIYVYRREDIGAKRAGLLRNFTIYEYFT